MVCWDSAWVAAIAGSAQAVFGLGQIVIVWIVFERGRRVWVEQFAGSTQYKAAEDVLYACYRTVDFLQYVRGEQSAWVIRDATNTSNNELAAGYLAKMRTLQANRNLLAQMTVEAKKAQVVLDIDIMLEVETIATLWGRTIEAYQYMFNVSSDAAAQKPLTANAAQQRADALYSSTPGSLDDELLTAYAQIEKLMLPKMAALSVTAKRTVRG